MNAHIDDRAAGIASLPVGDGERATAYEHAAACARCRHALDEAEALFTLLRAEPPLPGPSADALRNAFRAAIAEMEVSRPSVASPDRPRPLHSMIAVFIALVLSGLFAGFDTAGGSLAWRMGLECSALELAFGAGLLGLARLRSAGRRGAFYHAAFGAWGALAGQAYLHARCPFSHHQAHVFLFHFGGVVLAALLSSAAGFLFDRRYA